MGQAGTEELEEYTLQCRIQADDNEGPGLLLRVQQDDVDPTQVSFYRVQFGGNQATNDTRPPEGVSIQKCVAQGTGNAPVWTEVFRQPINLR